MADTTKKTVAKKVATKSTVAKKRTTRSTTKPAVTKSVSKLVVEHPVVSNTVETPKFEKPTLAKGKYVFATGRRKTAIANVRLFAGSEDNVVNKKKIEQYFGQTGMRNNMLQPLTITGLAGDFHFTANVSGGGITAQSDAIRHGIAQALASFNSELRTMLKKNGFLTRDPREKERKKPGLRRARRSPQWAKR